MDERSEQGGDNSGQGSRKRLIMLAVEFLLLLLSALLIGLFLFTVELKRPAGEPGGESASVASADLPTPSERAPIVAEISPRRRGILQQEMSELMDGMRFRMEHTQLEDVRWILDARTPEGVSSNTFYAYLGRRDGRTWGRLVAGCILQRHIFLSQITVDVDGTRYAIDVDFNDRQERELKYIDSIYEFADMPAWPYLDALRHAGKGHDVRVSLEGQGGTHDFRLTYDQIDALKRVIRLYDIFRELETAADTE